MYQLTYPHYFKHALQALTNYSPELEWAGFKITAQDANQVKLQNEWYTALITNSGIHYTHNSRKKGGYTPTMAANEAFNQLFRQIDYAWYYVCVAGKAICPLQKFGEYNTEAKLLGLFNTLCLGQAELEFKSEKAFRWRLSNGHELTIKQSSSTVETNEKPTMDIFSLISADQLFEVRVQFSNSSQAYSYKSEVAYEAGDKVVVDTPSNGMQVVTVTDSTKGLKGGNFPQYKWVVAQVDTARYEELVANEANAKAKIAAAQRADKVRKELEALGVTKDEVMAMLGLASKTDLQ